MSKLMALQCALIGKTLSTFWNRASERFLSCMNTDMPRHRKVLPKLPFKRPLRVERTITTQKMTSEATLTFARSLRMPVGLVLVSWRRLIHDPGIELYAALHTTYTL